MNTRRTEQEIMDLIIKIAVKDDRIRAGYMNDSSVNPNVKKDDYEDKDGSWMPATDLNTLHFILNSIPLSADPSPSWFLQHCHRGWGRFQFRSVR